MKAHFVPAVVDAMNHVNSFDFLRGAYGPFRSFSVFDCCWFSECAKHFPSILYFFNCYGMCVFVRFGFIFIFAVLFNPKKHAIILNCYENKSNDKCMNGACATQTKSAHRCLA